MIEKFVKLARDAVRGAQVRCIYATRPEYEALLADLESVRLYRSEYDTRLPSEYMMVFVSGVRVKPYPPLPIRMGRYGEWQ